MHLQHSCNFSQNIARSLSIRILAETQSWWRHHRSFHLLCFQRSQKQKASAHFCQIHLLRSLFYFAVILSRPEVITTFCTLHRLINKINEIIMSIFKTDMTWILFVFPCPALSHEKSRKANERPQLHLVTRRCFPVESAHHLRKI